MSSSQQPFYWGTVGASLLNATDYSVNLPSGTTGWTIINTNIGAGDILRIAGNGTTIAVPAQCVPLLPGASTTGKGQSLFVANDSGGALNVVVAWERHGRQPTSDAGTATITAL